MKIGNFQDIMRHSAKVGDCIEWTRAKSKAGYGQFWNGEKVIYVHRYVAELFYGEPSKGLFALHSCDNPSCCNPNHLRWGTSKENVKDMHDRGRANPNPNYGEEHHMSKITNEQATEIKKRRKNGEILRVIAADYGITLATVHAIATGKKRKKNASL